MNPFDSANQHDHGHGIVPNYTGKEASKTTNKEEAQWIFVPFLISTQWVYLPNLMSTKWVFVPILMSTKWVFVPFFIYAQ